MRNVGTGALGALIALALLGCDPTQPLFGPREVDVAPAGRRTVAEVVDYSARLEATARVDVRARTEGYLLERGFEDGTEVEQDTELFVLQPDAYDAALRAARAELKRDEAALEAARKNVTRLSAGKSDPESVEAATLAQTTAQAAVDSSRAAADLAQADASYTTLRAPIDGRIDGHPVDVGNLVSKGDRLATIVQLDPIFVTADVPADSLAQLQDSHTETPVVTQVVKADGTVHERAGRVQTIEGEIDAETGTVRVRAAIPNPRTDLLAGQDVTARFLLRWHVDAIVVPHWTVEEDSDGAFVLVVGGDGLIERRAVEPGPRSGGERVVHAGLSEGDRVVVGRRSAAVPGRRVAPVAKEITPEPTPILGPYVSAPSPAPPTPRPSPAATERTERTQP
ncbi:MAG: efflux RND transporter periplasmic adaptor subunit [Candidatus Binatia bacterium]|nr:efflux RND transporter periplasmic adaptor subunit [Candidatus Binatia bacterium]